MEPRHRAASAAVLSRFLFVLALAVATGFLVGWLAGDHSGRDWLLSFGGSAEIFGLLLVALPELESFGERIAPALLRVAGWLKRLLRRAEGAARRLLRRPRHHVLNAASGVYALSGMRTSGKGHVKQGATLQEQVEYLLRRDEKNQEKFEQMDIALEELPERWKADISEASETLSDEHKRALKEMRDRHIAERLLGVALLLVGIALATAGNLA